MRSSCNRERGQTGVNKEVRGGDQTYEGVGLGNESVVCDGMMAETERASYRCCAPASATHRDAKTRFENSML